MFFFYPNSSQILPISLPIQLCFFSFFQTNKQTQNQNNKSKKHKQNHPLQNRNQYKLEKYQ